MTDNGRNIKKAIGLINNVMHSACSAHMLYPKQTKQLNDIQEKELKKAINYLVLMLPSEVEWCDRLDATTIFSNSNYPMFNLIYPTMELLIKKFEPSDGQTKADYTNLLFGTTKQISDQSQLVIDNENSDESDLEYELEAPIILEQLRQLDSRFKNHRLIEPPVTTVELYDMVKATSYLSLKEYWEDIKITTINIVRRLCFEEKRHQPLIEEILKDDEFARSNNLMSDLYSNEELSGVTKENE
ncbi:2565_t:CDS:2, partial [Dentiscutata heterogama]